MAITNNGTKNSLPSAKLPTGYTVPTVTTYGLGVQKNTKFISIKSNG